MKETEMAFSEKSPSVTSGTDTGTARPDVSGMTIAEIRRYVAGAPPEPGDALWCSLCADPRAGVRDICERLLRRRGAERASADREASMRRWESRLWERGVDLVAGVDEVGRGPLAGPVVAAAVVLPRELTVTGIDDSKKLSPERRESLYESITREAVAFGVGQVSEKAIDEMNILRATQQAMREAVGALNVKPGHVLVDGTEVPSLGFPQTAMNQGDSRSTAIAAASIVAKVTRDRLMVELDAAYPGYGFARHKGYGTPEHLSALLRLGPCEIHRRSFKLVLDAAGGMSELYHGYRSALLASDDEETLLRIAREIAIEKHRLTSYELGKLRALFKRCHVRLTAGISTTK